MAAALLTRAARGGALSVGRRSLPSEASGARAAVAAIKTAGGTGAGVHGAARALPGGGGAASSPVRAGASRSMSTANGHGAVEPRCSCEREILQLRKELLDESRKNQALYGKLAEQYREVREFVTSNAEVALRKNSYLLLGCAAVFVFSLVTFAPYAEEVWRHRSMEAMEKKYGLVAVSRGRVAGTLHLEGGSAAAPSPAAPAPHGEEDKKQGK